MTNSNTPKFLSIAFADKDKKIIKELVVDTNQMKEMITTSKMEESDFIYQLYLALKDETETDI